MSFTGIQNEHEDSQFNTQESHSSNLFMPLHGQEDLSRLREKFKYDSDSSDNEKALMSLGRVSKWKPINSTQWLSSHSPLKKSSAGVRTRRNKPKVGCTLKVSSSGASITKSSPVTGYKEHEELKMDSRGETRNQSSSLCVMITDCPNVLNNGREANDVDLGNQEDDFWDGFSLAETEKPKLSVPPLSPKVNFQLDSQVAVPAPTNQYLRDYQREGIQFLYQHYINRTGAILADDMGLGKTIQVIGFLSAVLRKQGNKNDTLKMIPKFIKKLSGHLTDSPPNRKCKPFLIIGPSAVVYNWLDELNTWGYFIVRKFHGSDKDVCLSDLKKGKLEIVVTTFETYRDNLVSLNQIEWEAVFVDEVHKIKGVKSQVTLALKEINTPCRFGLTGTVLQNNLTELWSLLDWAQPGVLGTLPQFENDFIDVIELGQRQDATKRELAQARKRNEYKIYNLLDFQKIKLVTKNRLRTLSFYATNYLSDKNKTSHQEGSSLIDSTQEMPAMLLDMSTLASESQGPLPQPAAHESVGASVAVNTKVRQSKTLSGSQTRKGRGRATQSASNHGNKHKSSFVKETCLHAAMDVSENPAGKQIAVRASDSKVSEDTLTKQSCDDPFPHTFQKSRNSEKTLNKQRCNVAKVLDDIFQSSDDESEKETSFDEKMNQHLASPGKVTKSDSHFNDSCHSLDFLSKHSQENEFEFLIQRKCKNTCCAAGSSISHTKKSVQVRRSATYILSDLVAFPWTEHPQDNHESLCCVGLAECIQTRGDYPRVNPFSQNLILKCQHEEEEPKKKRSRKKNKVTKETKPDVNRKRTIQKGHVTVIVGQTPNAILRQQWSMLCKSRGVESHELARYILQSTQQDRLKILHEFYQQQFPDLEDTILEGLLSVFEQNHDKVLIFSYSTKLLDILEQYIIAKGHEYRRIDGKVSSLCRRNIVIQFNKDPNLFLCLISTKAGGLGLNMTAANRVIIFDPNWNPSHDLQAQDRAYRLGQCRDVQVFRLVSAGTIEENIYLRQIYKQQLDEVVIGTGNARRYFNGIQGDKENPGELFGIKNMFSLRPENSSLTLDIFKRNEKIEKALAGYDITKYIPSKEELSQQQEEDSDDTEVEEISFDSEAEKKEEELFYKNLFGSKDTSTFQTSPVQASIPETSPGKQGSLDLVADESDEEFSLIPKLHSTKVTPARSTEQRNQQALSGHHDLLSKQSKCPETSVPISHKIICEQAADVDYSTNHDEDLKLDQSSTRNPLRIHTGLQDPTRSSRSTSKVKTVAKKPMSGSSKEGKQKFTSIKSVLKKNGALHTLKNNQVVGSSRAEDHMTRCAIEDVFLKHINTQVPAVQCEPYSQLVVVGNQESNMIGCLQ
uniref:DNA excision repair protein ERCC-6-like 2 n=1 Tax=Biomphalaria glabrata TaxID=6526 RepID=A0A2C9L9G4_BIOGL